MITWPARTLETGSGRTMIRSPGAKVGRMLPESTVTGRYQPRWGRTARRTKTPIAAIARAVGVIRISRRGGLAPTARATRTSRPAAVRIPDPGEQAAPLDHETRDRAEHQTHEAELRADDQSGHPRGAPAGDGFSQHRRYPSAYLLVPARWVPTKVYEMDDDSPWRVLPATLGSVSVTRR